MNKKNMLKTVMVCTFSFICLLAFGQSKKAIILINSVPYHVLLSPDGEIEQVNNEAKGYMKGYKKSKEEFIFLAEDVASSEYLEGTSVRSDRILLLFEAGYATMDESTTAKLDKVADNYVPGKSEKLLITAFKAEESESNNLYDNRISTIRTYLELKGVPSNAISSEVAIAPALKNQLSLTYIQE